MTLRKAKGLSAEVVIVTDLDDDIMPGNQDVAEQRRLLYVSMARARKYLYLAHVKLSSWPTSFGIRKGTKFDVENKDGLIELRPLGGTHAD